jgi:hypothetical protein
MMPKMTPEPDYSEHEAAERRDEVIKRMLATPPQPRPKKGAAPKDGPKDHAATGKSAGS